MKLALYKRNRDSLETSYWSEVWNRRNGVVYPRSKREIWCGVLKGNQEEMVFIEW